MSDSDLVNCLRHMAEDHPCCEPQFIYAIDSLQQLERENAALKAKVEVIVKNYEDYKAENAVLRVALEDIMTESDEQHIWRMARAALQKEAQP